MTRLLVIRHSETDWNLEKRIQGHIDCPLNEAGLAQAPALGRRMRGEEYSALYSSDLSRAWQTAQAVADGREIIAEPRLRERCLGIFQGFTVEECDARYPEDTRRHRGYDPDYVIPEGESRRQFFHRVVACVEELARRHVGQTITLVTHGGTLENILRHVLPVPLELPRKFRVKNAGINVFSHEENDGWVLETWGDVSHLRRSENSYE
jgi:probable phosphoglycerate mutase